MVDSTHTGTHHHSLYFTSAELESGPGDEEANLYVSPTFAERERADNQLSGEELRGVVPPDWIKRLVLAGSSSEDIIRHLRRHIRREPSHRIHLLAEIVVNEVSELDDGPRVLAAVIDEALIAELESLDVPQT